MRLIPGGQSVSEDTTSADDWYDTALDLEATSAEEAIGAYRSALALDPGHGDAHLNLGCLLHEGGRLEEAEQEYRAAAEHAPGDGRARFNLGVVLEDRGDPDGAIEAYRTAIALDTGIAGAHYNLSRLLEGSGDSADAISHLIEYKRLRRRD